MKNKRPLPTEEQTLVLRRIAQSGGVLRRSHDERGDHYSDGYGASVGERTARALIRNGWVTAERGSMFDLAPQSWRVRAVS